MTGNNILEVSNLSVAFETERGLSTAVDDISFVIPRGSCVGIVGESGCGKSVTAMSLVRLLPQPTGHITSGKILFAGDDVVTMPLRRLRELRGGRVGFIFQEPMSALNPVHTIGDQIAETLMIHREMTAEAAWVEAINLLNRVRIPSAAVCANQYPGSLSGGMRQRVVIAIALACQPELIIADEPTTALDVTVQQQILALLRELREDLGASSLLITHDLGVIAQNCDRVLVMYAGRIVESAPVEELFANPRHAYTKALLAAMPRREYTRKTYLPAIPGHVESIRNYVKGCRFCQRMGVPPSELTDRPEMVEITPGHRVEACPRCTGIFS
ncbi:MAG: ABC transporter ATP-binding protein [Akkermansia sp.]|nr:ABC transporter ATP-binding protein [Akkermansia sp.]MBR2314407.1 ABC transporter ATP-binding protein [Akkermansia sp.]